MKLDKKDRVKERKLTENTMAKIANEVIYQVSPYYQDIINCKYYFK